MKQAQQKSARVLLFCASVLFGGRAQMVRVDQEVAIGLDCNVPRRTHDSGLGFEHAARADHGRSRWLAVERGEAFAAQRRYNLYSGNMCKY